MTQTRLNQVLALMISAGLLAGCEGGGAAQVETLVPTFPSVTEAPTPTLAAITTTPTNAATPFATPSPAPQLTLTLSPLAISPANVAEITQLAQFGKGVINNVTWSPDGKTLAVSSYAGIYLYNPETLKELLVIDSVGTVAFSPDGRMLASSASTGMGSASVQLWEASSGQLLHRLELDDGYDCAFLADGTLATCGFDDTDNEIRIWDAESGQLLRTIVSVGYGPAFSPDGRTFATVSDPRAETRLVRLIDTETGQLQRTLEVPATVDSIAYSPTGDLLTTSSQDGTARLWDVKSGELVSILVGASGSVAFSPDGRTLATRSGEDTRLWDIATGELLHTLTGGFIVAFSPDGRTLAVAGHNTVSLYDPVTAKLQRTREGYGSSVSDVAFHPDGRTLASAASAEGVVRLWDASTGQLLRTLVVQEYVESVAFSPDGRTLASGGGYPESSVQLWEVSSGQLIRTLEGETGQVVSRVAFSPDGRTLASGGGYGLPDRVGLWDASTGQLLFEQAAGNIAFSPDGRTFAIDVGTGEGQRSVWLYDLATLQLLRKFEGLGYLNTFSPDGHILVSAVDSLEAGLWDPDTGQLRRKFPHFAVGFLALSPDGRILAGQPWGDEPALVLLDGSTGQFLRELEGYRDSGVSVAFSPDGRLLASGSGDDTVRLWGLSP